jgi:hypothetical protein
VSEETTQKKNPEDLILPEQILRKILRTGLIIPAIGGAGKSESGKSITSYIIKKQPLPIQVKIFDVASNLRWNFEPILCQEITENTRFFYSGEKHILYDINMSDDDEKLKFIAKVIQTDYLKQRKLKSELGGHVDKFILYLFEESQIVLGRYALMKKLGRTVKETLSMGRNFGMSFIFIGRRLADMSTSAIEMSEGYLFGKMIGDNDLAKLRRIVGKKSNIVDDVKKLELGKGQFIYFDGSSAYDFNCPPYDSKGQKPIMWTPNIKSMPIWRYREGKQII